MTRDALIIIAAQKVEHYEIATDGGLVQLAKTMGDEKRLAFCKARLMKRSKMIRGSHRLPKVAINREAEQEPAVEDSEN